MRESLRPVAEIVICEQVGRKISQAIKTRIARICWRI